MAEITGMRYHAWLLCVFNKGMFLFCFFLFLAAVAAVAVWFTVAQLPCPVLIQSCPSLRRGQPGWATSHFYNAVHLSLGVLLDVQKYFHISDSHAGLLQTGKEPVLGPGARAFCQRLMGFCGWLQPLGLLAGESWGLNRLWNWSQWQDAVEGDRLGKVPECSRSFSCLQIS